MKSTRFTLQIRDYLKAVVMAIGAPVLTFIIDSLNAEEFTFNWKKLLIVAISAGATYLLKNFFTDDVKSSVKVITDTGATIEQPKTTQ